MRRHNGLFLSRAQGYDNRLYYATFIPGAGDIIAGIVSQTLPDAVIHKLLEGAILFETAAPYDKLHFFCFNNIFAVVNVLESSNPRGALESHITAVVHGKAAGDETIIAANTKKFRTFRIVVSMENNPAAIDEKLRTEAERYISRLSGLSPDRARPDAEFWFLYYSCPPPQKSFSLFMKRLTLRPSWEKTLHRGELPPPAAWLLCHLAGLGRADTVLDPFCGYGSIPQAALSFFHVERFIANDFDEKAAAHTAARFALRRIKPAIHRLDISALPSALSKNSIDAIVTDPPWGSYQKTAVPLEQFYAEMFAVFDTLLTENGRIVILGGRDDAIPQAAERYPSRFRLQKNIPVLISGKKAAMYVFIR